MSKARRDRIILGCLLAVLGFAFWNLWGNLRAPTVTSTVVPTDESVAQAFDTERFSSLAISADWADGIAEDEQRVRDPFQYGAGPSVRPAAVPPPTVPVPEVARPPVAPAPPPPPPPLPVEYVGFSRIGGSGAELRAVLMGNDGLPYPARAGETVLGRYRVEEVTEQFVVIEDLQSGRRERLSVRLQD